MIQQQVTFIYTRDLAASSAFLREVIGLDLVLNQDDHCHIYRVTGDSFLGVCRNRPVPDDPGVTYTFVVDDVDRVYGEWRARGVTFDGPPALSEKFNVYAAFFRDPAGYRFEIQEFRDSRLAAADGLIPSPHQRGVEGIARAVSPPVSVISTCSSSLTPSPPPSAPT